ncbi:hypothetical protein KL864_33705 [Mycolicibacterium goodii]|uniref:nuclear transport factor 2 family protein n=1 Tax=Mycolicibacterium goodii TaxID=134601 RepID=UPI001BDCF319|nr:hypothetical protein [Mycolicibacterium goodii]MBU8820822.1 hypothetical protein [Mycolicibacterium goodii]
MIQDNKATAIKYLRCLEQGDFAGMRALCTLTATVWHNDGKGEQTLNENLAGLEEQMTTESIGALRYHIVRQFDRPNEVLQQHVLNVATADGSVLELPVAMYFGFKEGLIDRIEEYANISAPPEDDTAPS